MKPEKQEEIYLALYQSWLFETSTNNFSKNGNKTLIEDVRLLIDEIVEQQHASSDSLAKKSYSTTLKNINFMLNDIMDIRAEKILNLVKKVEKIDETLLFKAEVGYYNSLYNAFKGYSKNKKIILDFDQSLEEIECEPVNFESSNFNSNELSEDLKSVPLNSPISNQEITSTETNQINEDEFDPMDEYDEIQAALAAQSNDKALSPEEIVEIDSQDLSNQDFCQEPINPPKIINYHTIRLLKALPALVGEDLEIYGPFRKDDIAFLPENNAQPLLDEKLARSLVFQK